MAAVFTADKFLLLGLGIACKTDTWKRWKESSKVEEFVNECGVHPRAVAQIWDALRTTPFEEDRIDESIRPLYLLIAYRWIKRYESVKELKKKYGLGEVRIRWICKTVPAAVAKLRRLKIEPNWNDDDGVLLAMTADGVHYQIDEPRPFSSSYKSHKHGSAGLCYEFGVYAHKNKVAWVNGPYPAGTNDKTIFRNKLQGAIEKKQQERGNNFRVIVDDGYRANDLLHVISLRNELDPKDIAYFKDRALARQETFNGWTKHFHSLNTKFRHDHHSGQEETDLEVKHARHKMVVEMVCVTLQFEMDLEIKTLFDPYP